MGDHLQRVETLQEELHRARAQLAAEQSRRETAERLASGALDLCAVNGVNELVSVLVKSFLAILGAEGGFVLRGAPGAALETIGSSSPFYASVTWPWDSFTERVATGRPAIVLRSERVPGWKAQPRSIRDAVGSSLHVCLQGGSEVVMLVYVHSEAAQFDRRDAASIDQITRPLQRSWARASLMDAEALLRRRAEEINRHLEGAQREILASRDQAQEASHAKSSFLARMSHELRTPLSGIIGLMDLALLTELAGTPKEYVEKSRSCASHLLTILNDILDLSKVEAGELVIEKIPIDLEALMGEAIQYASVLVLEKKVVLESSIDMAGSATHRLGDPLRIKQILLNLTSNAVKFTPDGVIRIRMEPQDANKVRLEISDTGIGMTPEFAAQVFEPFRQAEESTQRRFGGSGLGLAISRELVELMGGTIEVASELGVGSTFTVILPLEVVVDVTSEASHPEELPIASTPALRVLLAEDNSVNQLIATRMLERLGHEVVVAANGRIAVELALAESFDLILMDMQMPEMDGLEATRELRKRHSLGLPVIALTANALAGDRERCLEAGMTDYLTKPIREPDLVRALAKCWNESPHAPSRPSRKAS